MASHILSFPAPPSSRADRHGRLSRLFQSALSTDPSPASRDGRSAPGPRLVYSRRQEASSTGAGEFSWGVGGTQAQAHRIAARIGRELASRACYEDARRRGFTAVTPPQVTTIGLRERLLDAVLFFARPA